MVSWVYWSRPVLKVVVWQKGTIIFKVKHSFLICCNLYAFFFFYHGHKKYEIVTNDLIYVWAANHCANTFKGELLWIECKIQWWVHVHVHCSDKYFQILFSDDLNYFHQSQWKHCIVNAKLLVIIHLVSIFWQENIME